MSEMGYSIAPPDAALWLLDALSDGDSSGRSYVWNILPAAYPRYVRVLDPWQLEHGEGPLHRWGDLARQIDVDFYPEIVWSELSPATRPTGTSRDDHLFGTGDVATRERVVHHLGRAGPGPFYFRFDLVAVVALQVEPFVLVGGDLSLAGVRATAEAHGAPPASRLRDDEDAEHWWPEDRSWVVSRDYDLDEVYIACRDDLAEALLADQELEAVEVGIDSRVDWGVDEDRRSSSGR